MSRGSALDLVVQFMGRQNMIPVPVPFVRMLGDYASAALLAQCLYWGDRTDDPDGWFYKTHDEWQEELELSPGQVRRCVKTCDGMIEVKLKGVPAKNHYRANKERIAEALEHLANENQKCTARCGETPQLDVTKPHDRLPGNTTASRTENTTAKTEPTSEPTQNLQAVVVVDAVGEGATSQTTTTSLQEQNTANGSGASAEPRMASVTHQGDSQASQQPEASQTTSNTDVPGAGGARAALRRAFNESLRVQLLGEFEDRQAWLDLPPQRIDELLRDARLAQGSKYKTALITALDDAARAARARAAPMAAAVAGPVKPKVPAYILEALKGGSA